MALAEKHLAAVFNKPGHSIVDHHTFVLCGDGCLQEGVTSEASSLAGHLGLGESSHLCCCLVRPISVDLGLTACFCSLDYVYRVDFYLLVLFTETNVTYVHLSA